MSAAVCLPQTLNLRGDGPVSPAEGERVWNAVANLPDTQQGKGPALYVIAYSSCPYTAAFLRDWNGKLDNIQLHWILYPIDELTANTTADAAVSRDPLVLSKILSHVRTSPPARSSAERIDAYNRVTHGLQQLNGIFAQFRHYRVISPTFVWRSKGQVFVARGYERNSFENLILHSVQQAE